MTLVAITLITVGAADILRRNGRLETMRYPVPAVVFAFIVPVLLAWLVGVSASQDWLVLYVGVATSIGWILTSHAALHHDRNHALPLAILLAGLGVLMFFGMLESPAGWLARWLDGSGVPGLNRVGATGVLLMLGAGLIQLSTGNIVVRLILTHIGAMRPAGEPQPADRLKGGRLLGPMERLFILGLGLAGQVTAAGLVIAAKGLIRFPELQAQARIDVDGVPDLGATPGHRRMGIDELTEYFLIGSFVSWLVALSTLALVRFGS